jgi:hypothetical protein
LAQRPVSNIGFPHRTIEDFILVNGPRGQLAFFIEAEDQYVIQYLDTNLKSIRSQAFPKSAMSFKGFIMDIAWNDFGMYAYILNSRSRQFSIIGFGNDGRLEIAGSELLPEEELPLKGLAQNGNFYLLSVPRDKNQLVIRKYIGTGQTDISMFRLDKKPDFYKKLLVNESNGQPQLSDLTISHIRDYDWNFLEEGNSFKKVYGYKNKIYMIFDNNNSSEIIEYDGLTSAFSFNVIDYSGGYYYKTTNKGGNSFPCDKYLFRFSVGNDEEMSVKAINLENYKISKTVTINPRNQSRYLNGPPIEETRVNNDFPTYKTLKSYETLVRRFEDDLCISVNRINNDAFEIYAGTYSKTVTVQYMNSPSNYGGMGGMGMGMGGGMGMGMGGMGMGPGGGMYGNPSYSTPYTTTTVKTLYFKTLLEGNEMTYSDEYQENIRQKIQSYEEKVNKVRSESFSTIFKYNGHIIFAYFNRKSQSIGLVEF